MSFAFRDDRRASVSKTLRGSRPAPPSIRGRVRVALARTGSGASSPPAHFHEGHHMAPKNRSKNSPTKGAYGQSNRGMNDARSRQMGSDEDGNDLDQDIDDIESSDDDDTDDDMDSDDNDTTSGN